jgi:hypothetical protein
MSFSQSNEDFDYEKFSEPNPNNEFSLFLKKEIPKKLLKNIYFSEKDNTIVMSFSLNNENKPFGIKFSSNLSSELYSEIKKACEKYPFEKLNIEELDTKNSYSLQIISKKGSKNIFNCSSKIIIEAPSICENCEDLGFFEDIQSCLETAFKKHFYNTFNFSAITENEATIFFEYSIDKNGSLLLKDAKRSLQYSDDIKKTLSTFPLIKKLGTLNKEINNTSYSILVSYDKESENVYKEPETYSDAFSKPTTDNEFAVYLAKNLPEGITEKVNLNRLNNKLNLFFELDKRNKPFNIRTSARSTYLDSEIIAAFKKYPIQKLNFVNKSSFNSYILQIFSFDGNKAIINTDTVINYERIPVFPGCENSENVNSAKNCFSKGVQMHFSKKFNADLPNQIGLSKGRKRVFIGFEIDKNGDIANIKVSAPHIRIEEEVISAMQQFPKVKPGFQSGKAVNIKYSIPFTLIIE